MRLFQDVLNPVWDYIRMSLDDVFLPSLACEADRSAFGIGGREQATLLGDGIASCD